MARRKDTTTMHERERLTTTFGILLAGLIRAEDEATESERNPARTSESGVYPLGQALAEALVDEAIEHVAGETAASEL